MVLAAGADRFAGAVCVRSTEEVRCGLYVHDASIGNTQIALFCSKRWAVGASAGRREKLHLVTSVSAKGNRHLAVISSVPG